MVVRATVSANLLTLFSAAIYSLALVAMLGASAAHNCGQIRAGKESRRRLDHAAIFVMIAGTYTPFTVRLLPDALAIITTVGGWSSAIAGAFLELRYPRRFERLSIVIYLMLGWHGLFLAPSLLVSLPEPAAALIVAGGVLYSASVVSGRRNRSSCPRLCENPGSQFVRRKSFSISSVCKPKALTTAVGERQ
jgi:hemolysin III